MSNRDQVATVVLGVLVFLLFLQWVSAPDSGPTAAELEARRQRALARAEALKKRENPEIGLELLKWGVSREGNVVKATGSVRNNSGRGYNYVKISFDVSDSQGNRVGSAMDIITGLKQGQTWKFEALHIGSGTHFRLNGIETY